MQDLILRDGAPDGARVYELQPAEEPLYIQLAEAKGELAQTDYMALKMIDGELSEAEYEPIKARRVVLREMVRELERGVE